MIVGRIQSDGRFFGSASTALRGGYRKGRLQECRTPTSAPGALFVYNPADRKPAHYHGQLEWMIIHRGSATLRLGAGSWRLSPRMLVCVLPQRTHEILDESDDFSASFVYADPEFAARVYRGKREGVLESPFVEWVPALARLLAGRPWVVLEEEVHDALRRDFLEQHALQEQGRPPSLAPLLTSLRHELERLGSSQNDATVTERATALIADDPEMSAGDVAEALGISVRWLAQCLRDELGINVSELRSRVRITAFLALARSSENLLAAGLAAGFGSYSQLYRVFSSKTGLNPRNYIGSDGRNQGALIRRDSDVPPALEEGDSTPDA